MLAVKSDCPQPGWLGLASIEPLKIEDISILPPCHLSTYIWKLKDQRAPFTISWEIIGRAAPYNPATNKCRLCLLEKYLIMFKPAGASLNQNSEFFTTCRHKESHLLGKVKFKK